MLKALFAEIFYIGPLGIGILVFLGLVYFGAIAYGQYIDRQDKKRWEKRLKN